MKELGARLLLCLGLWLGGCAAHGSSVVPELPPGAALLPARVRRLSNWEVERSVRALTRGNFELARELPPDVRQEGYTRNVAQDVSSAWASRYASLVADSAQRAAQIVAPSLGCDYAESPCRRRAARALGEQAYRRALSAEEERDLDVAADDGLPALLRTLLEAPSFLYVTELGDVPGALRARLNDAELASELSYLLSGGPPDAELRAIARAGQLQSPRVRVREARRLLNADDTRYQFRRFALEWLEVDQLENTAKSSTLFPSYDALKGYMLAETESYVDEVLVHGGASVQALLASGFASVGPEMARFYGLDTYGARASLRGTGRLGVLQQASFLAAHAHEDVTSPVKRGDFVMRKLLCEKLKRPAEIGLEVVMPPPSATLSNRARLSQHVADPGCAACHSRLDAIGFTFESFDASGAAQPSDHGHAVETRAQVALGPHAPAIDVDSSQALTLSLLEKPVISECFARHAFRYFSAQADPRVEASFLELRSQLDDDERDNLLKVLVAYIASDLFVYRQAQAE